MSIPEETMRLDFIEQTSKMQWNELQKHFAQGVLFKVAVGLDLVDVAVKIAQDDKPAVEVWMESGQLSQVSMDDAKAWLEPDPFLWTVVTAPWVLVQEIAE
ncbi:MAG: DUF2288 domain-containing protein [Candidatus Polarisedimenticolaceae bacterium]|nr:DUF2288 domain-containing protein [Candidatus Polarisedimenticolaceae bacterium]